MNILIRGGTVIALEEDGGVQAGADVAISDGRIAFVGDAPVGFRPDEIVDATRASRVARPDQRAFALGHGATAAGYRGADGPEPWFDLGVTCDGQPPLPNAPPMTAEDAALGRAVDRGRADPRRRRGLRRPVLLHGGRGAPSYVESGLRANLAWCAFGGDGGEIGGDIADVAAWTERWQGAGGGRIKTSFGPHSAYCLLAAISRATAAVAVRLRRRRPPARRRIAGAGGLLASGVRHDPDRSPGQERPARRAGNPLQCDPPGRPRLRHPGGPRGARRRLPPGAGGGRHPTRVPRASAGCGRRGRARHGRRGAVRLARHVCRDRARRGACWTVGRTRPTSRFASRPSGGAASLGFPDSGRLAPGCSADLILLDTRRPHLTPLNDPLLALMTAARAGDVTDVMVAGQWLMRHGALTTLDEPRILAEAARRARRSAPPA